MVFYCTIYLLHYINCNNWDLCWCRHVFAFEYLVWIPVTVKDDDCVSRLQVEAQASCPGAEQEHKVLRGRVIECLQQHATVLCLGGSYGRGKDWSVKSVNLNYSIEKEWLLPIWYSHKRTQITNSPNVGLGQGFLTIQTKVLEVTVGKVVLHDGHEWGHLTEKQHFVVGGPQLGQDAIQQFKLPRGAVQVRAGQAGWAIWGRMSHYATHFHTRKHV